MTPSLLAMENENCCFFVDTSSAICSIACFASVTFDLASRRMSVIRALAATASFCAAAFSSAISSRCFSSVSSSSFVKRSISSAIRRSSRPSAAVAESASCSLCTAIACSALIRQRVSDGDQWW